MKRTRGRPGRIGPIVHTEPEDSDPLPTRGSDVPICQRCRRGFDLNRFLAQLPPGLWAVLEGMISARHCGRRACWLATVERDLEISEQRCRDLADLVVLARRQETARLQTERSSCGVEYLAPAALNANVASDGPSFPVERSRGMLGRD